LSLRSNHGLKLANAFGVVVIHLKPHFFKALSRRHADSGRAEELTIFITSLVCRLTVTRRQAQP
jgi:hypothetical protein